MNPLTQEWIDKAEGDFATTGREAVVGESPNYDAVCFHAQQCAEKYMKAHLQAASTAFGKTHDLNALLQLLLPIEPNWLQMQSQCRLLTEYAVDLRYPGRSATQDEANDAMMACHSIRTFARSRFGLT